MRFFLFLIFLISNSFASGLTGFCFDKGVNVSAVKSYLAPILTGRDKVYTREALNCVELKLSEARKPLFEKWINRRYRITRTYSGNDSGGSVMVPSSGITGNCRIEVKRVSQGSSTKDNISIRKGGSLSRSEFESMGGGTSRLLLGQGKKGHISVNGTRVGLICFSRGSQFYEMDVEVEGPRGSVSTSVTVSVGSAINIGEVVEDLNRKSRGVNIPNGIDYTKEKGKHIDQYYLLVR